MPRRLPRTARGPPRRAPRPRSAAARGDRTVRRLRSIATHAVREAPGRRRPRRWRHRDRSTRRRRPLSLAQRADRHPPAVPREAAAGSDRHHRPGPRRRARPPGPRHPHRRARPRCGSCPTPTRSASTSRCMGTWNRGPSPSRARCRSTRAATRRSPSASRSRCRRRGCCSARPRAWPPIARNWRTSQTSFDSVPIMRSLVAASPGTSMMRRCPRPTAR